MLKALHHSVQSFPALPKCNLVLASPWVFCKVCPEELYCGTVKTQTYSSQFLKNQVPASLTSNLTSYSICCLGNQSSSHRNHKGASRAAGVSAFHEEPHCSHNEGQGGPSGRRPGDVWGQGMGRKETQQCKP